MEIVATCRRLAKHPRTGTKRRDITPLPLRFWTVTRFPKMKRADAMQDTAFRTAFEQAKALLRVSFRQACVVVTTGLTLGRFGVAAYRCEHPVDLVKRKGLGIKIIADPVAHFFVPFVVGVVEGLYKVVESGDASTIFRWTRELTIRAGRIRDVRINGKPLLQDDAMLPAIAKIIRVDGLGADLPSMPERRTVRSFSTEGIPMSRSSGSGRPMRLWPMENSCMWPSSHPITACSTSCNCARVTSAGTSRRRQTGGLVPSRVTLT